jgi:hypothetical protein
LDIRRGPLQHANAFLTPSWLDGGRYYPRTDDTSYDEGVKFTYRDPFTGNAACSAKRAWRGEEVWDEPWARKQLIGSVELDYGVDVLRGC